ncbi:MAG TPA: hypothetical protein VGM33_10115 [Baekduia sp.]
MQTTRLPAGRSTSAVTAVLRALQASEEPRRLDALVRDTGGRDAPDVSRAVAVLLAQGLATRTPRGYTATKLGRRAAPSPSPGEGPRFPRSVAPARQHGA